jgi:hypothetical protein
MQAVGRLSSAEPPPQRVGKARVPDMGRQSLSPTSRSWTLDLRGLVRASPIVELLAKRIHFAPETDVFLQ